MAQKVQHGTHLRRKQQTALAPQDLRAQAKATFLADLRAQVDRHTYNVSLAARATTYARNSFYTWRAEDPEFGAAWDEIAEEAADMLEQIAIERGTTTSDILLIFMLKAMRPEKFREQVKHELSGPANGPIPFSYQSAVAEIAERPGTDSEG
jgi:hypothetical protein